MTHSDNIYKKAHHFSGILLIAFISTHLLNHLMILSSIESHIVFMDYYRKIYRFPPIEILLFCSLIFQIFSGGWLLRVKWKKVSTVWDKLQIYSGGYFIYFLIAHPAAVLFGRYVWNLDTNLYFGAAVLNINPLYYFFTLHYGFAILAFFVHVACVHRVKMKAYASERSVIIQSAFIIILGFILSVLILNYMIGIPVPEDYLRRFDGS